MGSKNFKRLFRGTWMIQEERVLRKEKFGSASICTVLSSGQKFILIILEGGRSEATRLKRREVDIVHCLNRQASLDISTPWGWREPAYCDRVDLDKLLENDPALNTIHWVSISHKTQSKPLSLSIQAEILELESRSAISDQTSHKKRNGTVTWHHLRSVWIWGLGHISWLWR